MIITLCGSNRFEPWFKIWNEALSLSGHLVFTTAVYPSFKEGVKNWYTEEEKEILDRVHKQKITVSSAIVVLNPMAYIGESTQSEINHAIMCRKRVYCLENWAKDKRSIEFGIAAVKWGIQKDYRSPISTTDFHPAHNLLGLGGRFRSNLVERINKSEAEALR